MKTSILALGALLAAFGASEARAELPKLPADTLFVGLVPRPAETLERAEAMAARVGLAPPNQEPGWLRAHPALEWTKGQVDTSRPIYVAITAPPKKSEAPFGDVVVFVPITKKANVEQIVAKLAGQGQKLASRREGGYLVVSENRKRLAKRARRRALPKSALSVAASLDVVVLVDVQRVNEDTVQAALDEPMTATFEDRLGKAVVSAMVAMSREATPKGELAIFGAKLAKDGLRIESHTPLQPKSEVGRWLLATPGSKDSLLSGHRGGAIFGGLGAALDGEATVRFVRTLFGRAKADLPKKDRPELAKIEAFGPPLAEAFTAHPKLSVAVRSRPQGAPEIVVVGPKIPEKVLAEIPDKEAGKADPKKGVPEHVRVALDPRTSAYIVDLGDRSLVAIGVGRLDLPELVKAVEAGTVPYAGEARYDVARRALPARLVLEAYADVGPIAAIFLERPDAAPFRPLAKLVGSMPPIGLGVAVGEAEVRTDLFVADGLLGLAGMAFSLAAAQRAGAGPSSP